jgi:aryl sulfotransferase
MSGFYWLASYPKSGSTWLRLALRSLERGGAAADFSDQSVFAPVLTHRSLFDAMLAVESSDLTDEEIVALRPRMHETVAGAADKPLIRKVHDAWCRTSQGEPLFSPALTLGTVYIARDPRDVAVSYAHHAAIPIDDAIAFLADPEAALPQKRDRNWVQLRQHLSSWSDHVAGWLDRSGLAATLIRYEDMRHDPAFALEQAARCLGWTVVPEALGKAVDATRFEALRAEEDRSGFREKPIGLGRFFRRGVAGGWRDSLSAVQVARIERDHGGAMARLGYL